MCGIVYMLDKKNNPVSTSIINQYFRQSTRGSDGFGFIEIDKKINVCRSEDFLTIRKKLEKTKNSNIAFHHRYPTSTPNVDIFSHPIEIKNNMFKNTYYLLHNGVITNSDKLKEAHNTLGIVYSTEAIQEWRHKGKITSRYSYYNDSETLGVELALYLEGKQKKINADGANAFILIETDKDGTPVKIHAGRNDGNPLKVFESKNVLEITSSGRGKDMKENVIHTYDIAGNELGRKYVDIGYYQSVFGFNNLSLYKDYSLIETTTKEKSDDDYLTELELERETLLAEIHVAKRGEKTKKLKKLKKELQELSDLIDLYD